MTADHVYKKDGKSISCFGQPNEGSNFKIIGNKGPEVVWTTGVPTADTEDEWSAAKQSKSATDWDRVCEFLLSNYSKDIVEVRAE